MTSFNFAALRADLSYCNYSIVNDFYHFPPLVEMKMILPIAEILCGLVNLDASLHRSRHIELVNASTGQLSFSFQDFSPAFNS